MKKLILSLIIIMTIPVTANAGWTVLINGVPIQQFKLHPVKAVAGALTAVGVHCVGHYAVASFFGKTMHQDGFQEVWHGSYTRNQEAWIGRGGFITQLSAGYILNKLDVDKSFKIGFNGMNLVEITSYPFVHDNEKRTGNYTTGRGDLGNIDTSGNSGNEVMLYTGMAIYNLNESLK